MRRHLTPASLARLARRLAPLPPTSRSAGSHSAGSRSAESRSTIGVPRLGRSALAAGLFALVTSLAPAIQAREAPQVGQPFGPLVLPAVDGSGPVDLASFRGRKVLLIEFASW